MNGLLNGLAKHKLKGPICQGPHKLFNISAVINFFLGKTNKKMNFKCTSTF